MDDYSRVFATIAYADIFHFPLTIRELARWIIGLRGISKPRLNAIIGKLYRQRKIHRHGIWVTLPGRQAFIEERKQRIRHAQHLYREVQRIVRWLAYIPTIRCVCLTGAIAMANTAVGDDIDLLIITSPGTLWMTRLLALCTIALIARRRKPTSTATQIGGSLCLNMFLDGGSLQLSKHDQNLYTAHELVQCVPVMDRGYMYRSFLIHNQWAKSWMGTAWKWKTSFGRTITQTPDEWNGCIPVFRIFEPFVRRIQLWYMAPRRTSEITTATIIRFHPHDAREWIFDEWEKRIKQAHFPLDKLMVPS